VEASAMLVHDPAHLDGTAFRAGELFRFEDARKISAEALSGQEARLPDGITATLPARSLADRPLL
jgi:hypothetical protein